MPLVPEQIPQDPITSLISEVRILAYRIDELDRKIVTFTLEMKEMEQNYVSKREHEALGKRVDKLEGLLWTSIKSIVSAAVLAVMGLVLKKGL